jgi:hypothetical protein
LKWEGSLEDRDFLTPQNPLGPFRHERIIRRAEDEKSTLLLSQVDLFDEVLARGSPLIMGRRGSGKTAIVNALLAASGNHDYFSGRRNRGGDSKDFYAFVNSWDHLAEMVEKVGNDIRHSMGDDTDWSAVLAETAARHWSGRFWQEIFRQVYYQSRQGDDPRDLSSQLRSVIKYFTGADFLPRSAALNSENIHEATRKLRKEVLEYLQRENASCYIVIDSLEEYPVQSPMFRKVLAGFLKCVNEFADDNPRCKIICCIPEEIEPILREYSSNKIKDLTTAASVSRLRWRPFDLLRIVAERYRRFLLLQISDDLDFISEIRGLKLSTRSELGKFFEMVMPKYIVNRFGQKEDSLAYIVRHSQLLPREFILIFSRAIVNSHAQKGSWRYIEPEVIVNSVEEQEPELVDQVMGPYGSLYPALIREAKAVVSELRPIFKKSDMDRLGGRLETAARHELYSSPWEVLYEMGVIGYLEDHDLAQKHAFYEYGRFQYNSKSGISFAKDRRYCIHPIFSGTWKVRQAARDADQKFIYPADVEVGIWEG